MKNFFEVPYSGNIQQIDPKQVSALALKDETESYLIQQNRVADAGLDVNIVAQTANGFIAHGDSKSVQAAYDVTFGGTSVAPKARASASSIIQFARAELKHGGDVLQTAFTKAANRIGLTKAFGGAASLPKPENKDLGLRPAMYSFEL